MSDLVEASLHDVASQVWGEDANPFYIVSPRYVRTSAGIRVLHHLCNILNRLGYPAFMIISPDFEGENVISPQLVTPVLTKRVAEAHYRSQLTPITIYPEVVNGNPFDAPFIVRFLGNFPGLLGGQVQFPPDEVIVPYSAALGRLSRVRSHRCFSRSAIRASSIPATAPSRANCASCTATSSARWAAESSSRSTAT